MIPLRDREIPSIPLEAVTVLFMYCYLLFHAHTNRSFFKGMCQLHPEACFEVYLEAVKCDIKIRNWNEHKPISCVLTKDIVSVDSKLKMVR